MTLFEDLGGEPVLRRVIDRFVDRLFSDVMIGFHFVRADRARIKDKEYEFAAVHLGAPVLYTGRPIAGAHAQHAILGGQFMRRLQILKDVLNEEGAPEHVRTHWVAHTLALRGDVTKDAAGRCEPEDAPGQRS